MYTEKISNLIHYYRKQSGLTQQELAGIAGVGKTVIYDIENGKETVRLSTLLKILEVLNIQIKFEPPFPQPKDNE